MVGFNENSTKYYSNSIYSVVNLPATTSTGSTNYLPSSDSSASGGSVYLLVPTTSYSYQYIYSIGLTYDTDVSFRFPRALNNDGYDGGDIQILHTEPYILMGLITMIMVLKMLAEIMPLPFIIF